MITLKTEGMTIIREKNDVLSCVPAQGNIYLKFKDHVEITIPVYNLSPQLIAYVELISKSTAKHITVDLTNPSSPVSFRND